MKQIEGICHCSGVRWCFTGELTQATVCNCTICRRYGAIWGYGLERVNITVTGETRTYRRGTDLAFHFCGRCGCVTHWRAESVMAGGTRRIGVNLRLAEPRDVAGLQVERLDGLETMLALSDESHCVGDYVS
ncbi:GFA family protein [Salinicola rhizosphaerae]|uniref:Aldehyde-activating protein n=1 Tax=Salinicola rhizosphaerae TaxID=1443141 RepID=A0ABQ3EB81_9GAMM|nr:aldehyde-activating protein [Salinicola rhizosphaerae]